MTNKLPTPERLRELLDYDPETGVLTWKPRTGKWSGSFNEQCAGKPAGTLRSDGYIALKIKNVIYPAHQVIWAWIHGEWPECVRHRNRIDSDNRLVNLRAVTRDQLQREVIAHRIARHRAAHTEADGRRFRFESLAAHDRRRPGQTYEFLGVTGAWRWTRERMQAALEAGLIVQSAPGQMPRLKRYLDEARA